MEQSKINKIGIGIILLIILLILGFFGFKEYQIHKAESLIKPVNKILETNKINRDKCKIIIDFDKELIDNKGDKFFIEKKYDDVRKSCIKKYDIRNALITENFCKNVIKDNKSDFDNDFIILDSFDDVRNKCVSKFFKVEFGTGSFFNVEDDFKSSVNIDFSMDFFKDTNEEDRDRFIENRIKAKQKLINLLIIEPKIDLGINDVILYKKRAILNLNLKPKTKYTFNLKSVDFGVGEKVETKPFVLNVPENKFFGFKINKKVTLFMDSMQPKFTFYKYNSDKTEAKIKICRVDNESYAKIEVYDAFPNRKFRSNFFKDGIDKIKTYDCKTKTLDLNPHLASPKGRGTEKNKKVATSLPKGEIEGGVIKQEFDFSKEIGEVARSGLYYVTFENKEDREFNSRIQKPIFFGIIDSHITMKIGANKSAFFFVNDFSGKPLANQEIRIYLNNFKSKKIDYEYNEGKYIDKTIYYSPFEKNVLSKPIYLGKTNSNGILNVNLKGKIEDAFDRTLNSWDYEWDGNLNSLFVTSASETNLSFVSSKYNGGITPWNFGYSVGSWWYGEKSENQDEVVLERWGEEKETLSHVFTDRKLYLPDEEVHIKAILRNSSDLSIPRNKKINLIVKNSKAKEVLNTYLFTNDYGSISTTLKLNKNSSLGNYFINLKSGEKSIGNSGFTVEIFKNPKFNTEVMLETEGLNGELVKITDTKIEKKYNWEQKVYNGDFKIKAKLFSKYYSGPVVKNSSFTYKVYKQYYYDNSYWDDCYFGCYWEGEKKLYTEGKGNLDDDGSASFEVPIKFESSYSDYKYIVEVTVKDKAGDIISSSNSIIAKLPSEYKRWDPNSGIKFEAEKRFYKTGESIEIKGKLNHGKFSKFYNDKFLLIIKRKDYENREVLDIRGKEVNKILAHEKVEKILKVNDKNFKLNSDGTISLNYKTENPGEYVFEYGKINNNYFINSDDVINEFNSNLSSNKDLFVIKSLDKKIKVTWDSYDNLERYCYSKKDDCESENILEKLGCNNDYVDKTCRNKEVKVGLDLKITVNDLIDPDSRKYFVIISYGEQNAKNPIVSDNKIGVLSEKISYHLGEKARILVRLPSSNGKILLTTEKKGVINSELIPVKSNIFFKEFNVDDSFAPNTYIGVLFIPALEKGKIPEYKVGYTEIVVDKTDKKAFINLKTNKKEYKPRETVKLDIDVKDKKGKAVKSELTVMVVDDSLISLLGNVDLNTLEKFYKKLPFRIQTAITNIAMLRNYYFSRKGIVGGSGFGEFKGGDSAVSSRNIFRNTAYYNSNIITDWNGKAHVEFNLPDNLTNFRVMVLANSKKNFFGMSENFIEVRKNVIVQDKTPIILRHGDKSIIGAQVFNNTKTRIGLKIELDADIPDIINKVQNVYVDAGKSNFISWGIIVPENIKQINYTIKALGDSIDNSDKLQNKIEVKSSPILITNTIKNLIVPKFNKKAGVFETNVEIPENTDISKSKVEVIFSNNRLTGIDKIVSSLAHYPYGCIEQTISSTLPNAIVLKYSKIFGDLIKNKKEAEINLKAGIDRLGTMQLSSGGFAYWQGETSETSLKINAYVLYSMLEMQKVYYSEKLNKLIKNSLRYLENNFNSKSANFDDNIEIFYVLNKYSKKVKLSLNSLKLNRYELLQYTYGLYYYDKDIYSSEIKTNIEKLKQLFKNSKDYNNYYSNITNEKALFTRLLLDLNYDNSYTEELIGELYEKDWSNYYYSTKTKANVFLAFASYLEKNSIDRITRFGFSLGRMFNRQDIYYIGGKYGILNKMEFNLKDLIITGEKKLSFRVANLSPGILYADIILKEYPKDILKVKAYSNKVNISRNVYEILDEEKLDKCNNYWNYNYRKYSQEFKIACDNALKQVKDNTYKKGSLYMVKIKTNFKNSGNKENFVIEDYLPGTFRIINSSFKTESATLKQNQNNWSWNHIEYRPDVVMANNRYVWGETREFNYFVRPEFKGQYTQPPVTGYFMYNPLYRANSGFNIIEVK